MSKERVLSNQELYDLCNRYSFFTAGTNGQYEKLFDANRTGASLRDLAIMIWLCSEDVTLPYVYGKLLG